MARQSTTITESEIAAYEAFCKANNIVCDESQPGVTRQNGDLLGGHIVNTLNADINQQTLTQALEKLRDQVVFYSPAQLVAKQAGIDQHQADVLFAVLQRRGDLDMDNYGYENAVAVANWIKDSSRGIDLQSINLAVGNLPNSPSGYRSLHFKRRLQDREKELLAQREKNKAELEQVQKERAERAKTILHPELRMSERARAHKEMMERSASKVIIGQEALKDPSGYTSLAKDAVNSITSPMDRAVAEELLGHIGGWGPEVTYRSIINFIERRKSERATAAQLATMGRR